MTTDNTARSILRIALATAFLLSVPLVAMQFSDDVVWGPFDFAVAGTLLFGSGLTYVLVARKGSTPAYRVAVGIAVAAALFLVWSSLAVGVIGSEDNPANAMYLGVLAVGFVGALIARFEPRGMARALFAMAFAQALVALIAVGFAMGAPVSGPLEILLVNGFFVALFAGSASLFQHAARVQSGWA